MKIYRKLVLQWSEELGHYIKLYEDAYEYYGPVDRVCGPTAAQSQILGQQQGFASQVTSQAGAIFGNASTLFNSVMNSLVPTISAGPSQSGFSASEMAARNAGVVTAGSQAAANAKSAIGNANASQGGGNTGLTAGATTVAGANAAADIAQGTAGELNKVQQESYDVGRQEYSEAIKGAEGATEMFNPATSAASAGTESLNAAASNANTQAAQSQSWVNAAIGALGSVAGAATGKLINNSGGGNNNDSQNQQQPSAIAPSGSGNSGNDAGW